MKNNDMNVSILNIVINAAWHKCLGCGGLVTIEKVDIIK